MANLFEKVSFCGRSSLQRIDNKDVACSLSIALTLGVKRNDFERHGGGNRDLFPLP